MKSLKNYINESLFSFSFGKKDHKKNDLITSNFIYNFTKYIKEGSSEKRKEKLEEFIQSEDFKKFLIYIFNIDLDKNSRDYSIDLSGKLGDEPALIIKINSANGIEFILKIIYVTDGSKVIITLGKCFESSNQYSHNLKRLGFKEIKSNNLTSYELKYKVPK